MIAENRFSPGGHAGDSAAWTQQLRADEKQLPDFDRTTL